MLFWSTQLSIWGWYQITVPLLSEMVRGQPGSALVPTGGTTAFAGAAVFAGAVFAGTAVFGGLVGAGCVCAPASAPGGAAIASDRTQASHGDRREVKRMNTCLFIILAHGRGARQCGFGRPEVPGAARPVRAIQPMLAPGVDPGGQQMGPALSYFAGSTETKTAAVQVMSSLSPTFTWPSAFLSVTLRV